MHVPCQYVRSLRTPGRSSERLRQPNNPLPPNSDVTPCQAAYRPFTGRYWRGPGWGDCRRDPASFLYRKLVLIGAQNWQLTSGKKYVQYISGDLTESKNHLDGLVQMMAARGSRGDSVLSGLLGSLINLYVLATLETQCFELMVGVCRLPEVS
jgi:hypothetical protein